LVPLPQPDATTIPMANRAGTVRRCRRPDPERGSTTRL
jgi:hypothetical protein